MLSLGQGAMFLSSLSFLFHFVRALFATWRCVTCRRRAPMTRVHATHFSFPFCVASLRVAYGRASPGGCRPTNSIPRSARSGLRRHLSLALPRSRSPPGGTSSSIVPFGPGDSSGEQAPFPPSVDGRRFCDFHPSGVPSLMHRAACSPLFLILSSFNSLSARRSDGSGAIGWLDDRSFSDLH